jgi:hypothetical protein
MSEIDQTRKAQIEKKIIDNILSWDITAELNFLLLPFELHDRIANLCVNDEVAQLLTAFELANFSLTHERNSRMIVENDGIQAIENLLNNARTTSNVRFYAEIAFENLKKCQNAVEVG